MEKHIAICAPRSTAGFEQKTELQIFSVHGAIRAIAADILRPVTLVKKSRTRYILVICDSLTNYALTVALQENTAVTVGNAIIDEWILNFGAPDVIHTDQGSNFNSEIVQHICRVFMIEKTRTAP